MMSHEILPGLFLEITTTEEKIVATRLVNTPGSSPLGGSLRREIALFLTCWRRHRHEPLPDALFRFPENLATWAPLLLHLKNSVAPGQTITYRDLGIPFGIHPRTVGMIMARNPFPLLIPCHRVVGADGRLTGFSAAGGLAVKRRLLCWEGALP